MEKYRKIKQKGMSMGKKTIGTNGLAICLTGNGKGKTSAALGMVMRALAHKKKVLFVQFIKGTRSGEITFLSSFRKAVVIRQFGAGFCRNTGDEQDHAVHKRCAAEGLAFVKQVLVYEENKYDIIVLDEINLTFKLRLLTVKAVMNVLDLKPRSMHIVLTGRYAPRAIQEKCDLVSEVREIKHPFKQGVRAQAIIEF